MRAHARLWFSATLFLLIPRGAITQESRRPKCLSNDTITRIIVHFRPTAEIPKTFDMLVKGIPYPAVFDNGRWIITPSIRPIANGLALEPSEKGYVLKENPIPDIGREGTECVPVYFYEAARGWSLKVESEPSSRVVSGKATNTTTKADRLLGDSTSYDTPLLSDDYSKVRFEIPLTDKDTSIVEIDPKRVRRDGELIIPHKQLVRGVKTTRLTIALRMFLGLQSNVRELRIFYNDSTSRIVR
jgi:hypothetical protein